MKLKKLFTGSSHKYGQCKIKKNIYVDTINKIFLTIFSFLFIVSTKRKRIKDMGKNKPNILVEVDNAANKENKIICFVFDFLKILIIKKIDKTTKDKNKISLLL